MVGHRDQDRPEKPSPLLLEREEGEEEKGGATASTDSVSPVSLGGEKKEKEEVELESGRVYEARRERERESRFVCEYACIYSLSLSRRRATLIIRLRGGERGSMLGQHIKIMASIGGRWFVYTQSAVRGCA